MEQDKRIIGVLLIWRLDEGYEHVHFVSYERTKIKVEHRKGKLIDGIGIRRKCE